MQQHWRGRLKGAELPGTGDYLDALVQRDVRNIARISSLDILPRLLTLAASQTARLLNVADLSSPFQVSRPTIRDYVYAVGACVSC